MFLVFILKGSKQASGDMIRSVFLKDCLTVVIENGSGGWDERVLRQEASDKPGWLSRKSMMEQPGEVVEGGEGWAIEGHLGDKMDMTGQWVWWEE